MALDLYLRNVPRRGTGPFSLLISSYGEIFEALSTYVLFADNLDRNRRVAIEALAFNRPDDSDEAKALSALKSEKIGPARKRLSQLSDYNNRAAYQLSYNVFLTYISSLIKDIFNRNKEMLNTKNQISYREIIRFTAFRDLTDYMIEKRVTDLAFQSIGDFNTDFNEKYGFKFFETAIR